MSDNFIYQQYLEDISVCDDLIKYFDEHPFKKPGQTDVGVNIKLKDSTDLSISMEQAVNSEVITRYLDQLQKVCDGAIKKYSHLNIIGRFGITEKVNIQHYKPDQGYHAWHCERAGYTRTDIHRCLVFMTYLNDVDNQGETEFLYQGVKIKPRKGLTLIWPTDWTHTHRGIASPTEDKYIITGWYSFININGR